VLNLSLIAPEVQSIDVVESQSVPGMPQVVVGEIVTRDRWMIARDLNSIEGSNACEVGTHPGLVVVTIHCHRQLAFH
jgi:hypothetical protein